MTIQISAEQMQAYRHTARQRWQAEQAQLARRRERAWQLARQAAEMLKRDFAARVVVFGSLVHQDCFTEWSDVDLAAWGLDSTNWLKAIGRSPATIGRDRTEPRGCGELFARTARRHRARRRAAVITRYRHIVRNVYTFNLKPERVVELVHGLRPTFDLVQRDLTAFVRFLEELSTADQAGGVV